MRADSRTGRIVGALGRTDIASSHQATHGLARYSTAGRIIEAIGRVDLASSRSGERGITHDSHLGRVVEALGRRDRSDAYHPGTERRPEDSRHTRTSQLVTLYARTQTSAITKIIANTEDLNPLDFPRDLIRFRDLKHTRALALENDLDHALTLTHELGKALERDIDRSLARARDLNRHLSRALSQARTIVRALKRNLRQARALARDLETARELAVDLSRILAEVTVNVSGVDLTAMRLDIGALEGVIWNRETRWPAEIEDQVAMQSREIADGLFQVTSGDARVGQPAGV